MPPVCPQITRFEVFTEGTFGRKEKRKHDKQPPEGDFKRNIF